MLPLALNGEAIKQKFGTTNLSDRIEILREDMEEFYSGKVASEYIISFACLAVQDVQEYKRQQRDSRKRDKARNDLSFQLAEARTLIAALEQELAACREQLEKVRIEKPAPNARTSAATQARQEKKLTEWRGAFKVMLKVALQCQAEGPKSRTTPELKNMCARHDYPKPTGEQIKFLRECLLETLGSDYVNTTGGPTIQG